MTEEAIKLAIADLEQELTMLRPVSRRLTKEVLILAIVSFVINISAGIIKNLALAGVGWLGVAAQLFWFWRQSKLRSQILAKDWAIDTYRFALTVAPYIPEERLKKRRRKNVKS